MVFSGCVEVDKPSLVFREAEKGGPEGRRRVEVQGEHQICIQALWQWLWLQPVLYFWLKRV